MYTPEVANEVKLLASNLLDGERLRAVCPVCHGGATRERSLLVSRNNGVLQWKCFRGNCPGNQGKTYSGANVAVRVERDTPRELIEANYDAEPLDEVQQAFLAKKYDLPEDVLPYNFGVMAWNRKARILFPVVSWTGARIGWVARSYDSWNKPKTLTLKPYHEPTLSFAVGGVTATKNQVAWVVEDIPSALTVAYTGGIAIALLGTSLGAQSERALQAAAKGLGVTRFLVALDPDEAGIKSGVRVTEQIRLWSEAEHVIIDQDFKEMKQHERQNVLGLWT